MKGRDAESNAPGQILEQDSQPSASVMAMSADASPLADGIDSGKTSWSNSMNDRVTDYERCV